MSVTRDKSTLASDPCQWFATTEKPNTQTPGLTKREYFAALAMQGMLSNGTFEMVNKEITEKAIAISDALIEELNK